MDSCQGCCRAASVQGRAGRRAGEHPDPGARSSAALPSLSRRSAFALDLEVWPETPLSRVASPFNPLRGRTDAEEQARAGDLLEPESRRETTLPRGGKGKRHRR